MSKGGSEGASLRGGGKALNGRAMGRNSLDTRNMTQFTNLSPNSVAEYDAVAQRLLSRVRA